MRFEEMNVPDYILSGLRRQGIEEATEIQSKCIPIIRSGADVIGASETGSGKTYAFGIPIVESVDTENKSLQCLIVCPTRELAIQIGGELRKLTTYKESCKIVPVYGGADMIKQIKAVKSGAKIIVGTPGRILDHIERRTIKLKDIKTLVLDEADEMLKMGFREDLERIISKSNPDRQTVMFSATMPKPVLELARKYMKNPVQLSSESHNSAQSFIEQHYLQVGKRDKDAATLELLMTINPTTAIIFCNTKRKADELAARLNTQGMDAAVIHGDMRQSERKKVVDAVKKNGEGIIVATDVLARGIDINDVNIVINYDLPSTTEYYIHRIGRTARAGKKGAAFTILNTKAQYYELQRIIQETGNVISLYQSSVSIVKDTSARPAERVSIPAFKIKKGNANARKKQEGRKRQDSRGKAAERREHNAKGDKATQSRSGRKTDSKKMKSTTENHREKDYRHLEKKKRR